MFMNLIESVQAVCYDDIVNIEEKENTVIVSERTEVDDAEEASEI